MTINIEMRLVNEEQPAKKLGVINQVKKWQKHAFCNLPSVVFARVKVYTDGT